ncbi:PIN domain-containing protein [Thermococcus sp. MAR1]|uniref:PIN domain-containing protein n=1 Tax=Thermococcus sp. MAR1 TaxID=1638263 RepID=UPI002101FDF6|nr:PIN domain-containing protein [Thermococcus sp. MAR1]
MEVVLDFNLVFSALHSRGKVHLIFAWNYVVRKVDFLVPEFFWEEIEGKWKKIINLTKLTEDELFEILEIIKSQTVTVPKEEVNP